MYSILYTDVDNSNLLNYKLLHIKKAPEINQRLLALLLLLRF